MVFRKIYIFIFAALAGLSSVYVSAASQNIQAKQDLMVQVLLDAYDSQDIKAAISAWDANGVKILFQEYLQRETKTKLTDQERSAYNSFLADRAYDLYSARNNKNKLGGVAQECAQAVFLLSPEVLQTRYEEKLQRAREDALWYEEQATLRPPVQGSRSQASLGKSLAQNSSLTNSSSVANNGTNNKKLPVWRSTAVMGTSSGASFAAYLFVLNARWEQDIRAGKTKLSRAAYISKEFFSVRLNDWTTYLKLFAVGTAGVAIYNQVTK